MRSQRVKWPEIRFQWPQKCIEMFISFGGQDLFFVCLCNQPEQQNKTKVYCPTDFQVPDYRFQLVLHAINYFHAKKQLIFYSRRREVDECWPTTN